jgi:ACS family glucarate transporter-like MFS transporter
MMNDESDHGSSAARRSTAAAAPIHQSSFITHQSPSHVRWKVMAFLCALSFLTYFDRFCIVRAQGDIQNTLHISDAQIGWIMGAFWLAYALFEIPGGWLGDRYGSRGSLTRIVLAWSLFTALSGTATGFLSLLAYRFLFGVGEAGAFPNMARVQAAWLPIKSRARWGGMLWLMARWGGAFSPVIVGALLRAFASPSWQNLTRNTPLAHLAPWRLGFWTSGLMGILWVLLFYPFFRDNPADKPTVNPAELDLIRAGRDPTATGHTQHSGLGTQHSVFPALFTSPSLWAFAVLYLCVSFGWSFFASWIPRFFKDVQGVDFNHSEWLTTFPLFFGGLSCLAGGALCDYLVKLTGRKRLVRTLFPVTGYLAAAIAFVSLRWVHTPIHAAILCCVIASASDFGQGSNWSSIVDIGGRYAGTALGLVNTLGNLGHFLQPPVGQWVFHTLGWNALFVVYAAAFAVAAAMWLFINPDRPFYPEPPQPVPQDQQLQSAAP